MTSEPSRAVVVGMGYVGYPLALLLARAGYEVVGVDIRASVVERINRGECLIDEPGLRELAAADDVRARLRGSGEPEPADVFIVAVPTPLRPHRKTADLSQVEAAMQALTTHLREGSLVILESTVPPRTCRELILPILEESGLSLGSGLLMAHCPERVLPGRILEEIVGNDRIVGGCDEASTEAAAAMYATFVEGELIRTDDVTAELCKLMENTYRDVNIALANELARVAKTMGVDIRDAIEIANRHPRVNLLKPGIGVGGHCIPIDPWFIAEVAPEVSRLIPTARQINDLQPSLIAGLIRHELRDVPGARILCLGATYKPDVRDLREAPALEVVRLLRHDGYEVDLFDPITDEYGAGDLLSRAKGVDLVAVLVPHTELMATLHGERETLRATMAHDSVIDLSTGYVQRL